MKAPEETNPWFPNADVGCETHDVLFLSVKITMYLLKTAETSGAAHAPCEGKGSRYLKPEGGQGINAFFHLPSVPVNNCGMMKHGLPVCFHSFVVRASSGGWGESTVCTS